jgi:hypothetical protein
MNNFKENADKIAQAIEAIRSGVCKRIDVNSDIKVYECKNIVRIDIKVDKEEE